MATAWLAAWWAAGLLWAPLTTQAKSTTYERRKRLQKVSRFFPRADEMALVFVDVVRKLRTQVAQSTLHGRRAPIRRLEPSRGYFPLGSHTAHTIRQIGGSGLFSIHKNYSTDTQRRAAATGFANSTRGPSALRSSGPVFDRFPLIAADLPPSFQIR